jgi:hypothetical protein
LWFPGPGWLNTTRGEGIKRDQSETYPPGQGDLAWRRAPAPGGNFFLISDRIKDVNWAFVAEIPKTAVGKFDKKMLRAGHAADELKVERLTQAAG